MGVTLVLCSKNGGERIKRCLEYISTIKTKNQLDIVLIDNGSTDDSWNVVNKFCETSLYPCSAIHVETPGNSAGRNAGITRSIADIILFIDDDCYVNEHFVDDWIEVFKDPDIGYATGIVRPYDSSQSLLGCRVTPDVEMIGAHGAVPRGLIQGSNMAFRRKCLDDAGPFDPRFGAGTPFAGEEWDVAIRASRAGWKGGYFPGPSVLHDHGRGTNEAASRDNYYIFGGGAVYAKSLIQRFDWPILKRFVRELWRSSWSGRLNMLNGAMAFVRTAGRHKADSAPLRL